MPVLQSIYIALHKKLSFIILDILEWQASLCYENIQFRKEIAIEPLRDFKDERNYICHILKLIVFFNHFNLFR
jgi:hypothetical protein